MISRSLRNKLAASSALALLAAVSLGLNPLTADAAHAPALTPKAPATQSEAIVQKPVQVAQSTKKKKKKRKKKRRGSFYN